MAGRIGDRGLGAVKREADADPAGGEEIDRRPVEQRAVGLEAEDEIVAEGLDGGEHRLPVHQRLGAVEDDARPAPRGHHRREVATQLVQRRQQLVLRQVPAVAAHLAGQVAIGAVEVAALGGVHVDGRRLQSEAQRVQLAGEIAGLLAVGVEQRPAGQDVGNARLVHQRPEGGAGVGQRHVAGVADVHRGQGGGRHFALFRSIST